MALLEWKPVSSQISSYDAAGANAIQAGNLANQNITNAAQILSDAINRTNTSNLMRNLTMSYDPKDVQSYNKALNTAASIYTGIDPNTWANLNSAYRNQMNSQLNADNLLLNQIAASANQNAVNLAIANSDINGAVTANKTLAEMNGIDGNPIRSDAIQLGNVDALRNSAADRATKGIQTQLGKAQLEELRKRARYTDYVYSLGREILARMPEEIGEDDNRNIMRAIQGFTPKMSLNGLDNEDYLRAIPDVVQLVQQLRNQGYRSQNFKNLPDKGEWSFTYTDPVTGETTPYSVPYDVSDLEEDSVNPFSFSNINTTIPVNPATTLIGSQNPNIQANTIDQPIEVINRTPAESVTNILRQVYEADPTAISAINTARQTTNISDLIDSIRTSPETSSSSLGNQATGIISEALVDSPNTLLNTSNNTSILQSLTGSNGELNSSNNSLIGNSRLLEQKIDELLNTENIAPNLELASLTSNSISSAINPMSTMTEGFRSQSSPISNSELYNRTAAVQNRLSNLANIENTNLNSNPESILSMPDETIENVNSLKELSIEKQQQQNINRSQNNNPEQTSENMLENSDTSNNTNIDTLLQTANLDRLNLISQFPENMQYYAAHVKDDSTLKVLLENYQKNIKQINPNDVTYKIQKDNTDSLLLADIANAMKDSGSNYRKVIKEVSASRSDKNGNRKPGIAEEYSQKLKEKLSQENPLTSLWNSFTDGLSSLSPISTANADEFSPEEMNSMIQGAIADPVSINQFKSDGISNPNGGLTTLSRSITNNLPKDITEPSQQALQMFNNIIDSQVSPTITTMSNGISRPLTENEQKAIDELSNMQYAIRIMNSTPSFVSDLNNIAQIGALETAKANIVNNAKYSTTSVVDDIFTDKVGKKTADQIRQEQLLSNLQANSDYLRNSLNEMNVITDSPYFDPATADRAAVKYDQVREAYNNQLATTNQIISDYFDTSLTSPASNQVPNALMAAIASITGDPTNELSDFNLGIPSPFTSGSDISLEDATGATEQQLLKALYDATPGLSSSEEGEIASRFAKYSDALRTKFDKGHANILALAILRSAMESNTSTLTRYVGGEYDFMPSTADEQFEKVISLLNTPNSDMMKVLRNQALSKSTFKRLDNTMAAIQKENTYLNALSIKNQNRGLTQGDIWGAQLSMKRRNAALQLLRQYGNNLTGILGA